MEVLLPAANDQRELAYRLIHEQISQSRFKAIVETRQGSRKFDKLAIVRVRLRTSAKYCGNHGYACSLMRSLGVGRTPKKGNWLEGGDWISFLDMLNNVLDTRNIEATIRSRAAVKIGQFQGKHGISFLRPTWLHCRKGHLRCVNYNAHLIRPGMDGTNQWTEFLDTVHGDVAISDQRNGDWSDTGDFEEGTGKELISDRPLGTPGNHDWKEEKKQPCKACSR